MDENDQVVMQVEHERDKLDLRVKELNREKDSLEKCEEEVASLYEICSAELERYRPAVHASVKSVGALDRGDIYDLKGLTKFSKGIELVMEAVLVLMKFEMQPDEPAWDSVKR
jgi:hypothetical protein